MTLVTLWTHIKEQVPVFLYGMLAVSYEDVKTHNHMKWRLKTLNELRTMVRKATTGEEIAECRRQINDAKVFGWINRPQYDTLMANLRPTNTHSLGV